MINRVLDALATNVGAAPAIAVTDTLWHGVDATVTGVQDRQAFTARKHHKVFTSPPCCAAHAASTGQATDDVAVARAAGLDVAIVAGDEDEYKDHHARGFRSGGRADEETRHPPWISAVATAMTCTALARAIMSGCAVCKVPHDPQPAGPF